MTKVHEYLFGADPEVFVYDVDRKQVVSAHDLLPGTKDNPHATKHGSVLPDGVAAEFNIPPAATTEEFINSINAVMGDMRSIIGEKISTPLLLTAPTAFFKKDYWKTLPKAVQALGCMPDYNAWTLKRNKSPDGRGSGEEIMRSIGFHLHVGYSQGDDVNDRELFKDKAKRVRQLECAMYPTSLLYDNDTERRRLYGQMGAFRPKPYGFEWRTLSSKLLREKDEGLEWLVDTARFCMEEYDTGVEYTNDKTVVETMSRIAGGEATDDEILSYVYDYMPNTYGIEVPSFLEK